MAEKRSAYILNLKGDLEARSRRFSRAMARMARGGRREMGALDRSVHRMGARFDQIGNRYTAILTGGAALAGARYLGNLQHRFTRLGITADQSAEQMDALKKRIFEVAQAPDIRVDAGGITSAIESIVEKTGDLDFARDNIRNIGLAMQATGADGAAIGELFGEFEKAGITSSARVLKAIDTLNVQGKAGAFTLENLAALGPRVITAYTAGIHGQRDGVQVLREMGAALQVIRQGTGSAEQAATAFEGVLRTVANPAKLKALREMGIQVFDPDALKKGEEVLRPINELMTEIYQKTGGKRSVLGQIFDAEGVRAFNALSPAAIAKYYDVQADGTQTQRDAARAAHDFNAVMQSLLTTLQKFADSNLSDEFGKIADELARINPDQIERALKVAAGGAGILAGVYGYRKLRQGTRAVSGALRHSAATQAVKRGETGALGNLRDVQKVFVVNMGKAGMGAAGAERGRNAGRGGTGIRRTGAGMREGATGRGLGRRGGRLASAGRATRGVAAASGRALGAAADIGAAASVGYGVGTVINNNFVDNTKLGDAIGSAVAHTLAFFGNDEAQAAVKQMQHAAETMQRAADKMNNADTTVHLQVEQGHVRVAGLTDNRPAYRGPLAAPDPYNGPLRAGVD